MNSNVMAGERRWASARRGGMTVLGKVAVPKPLNLPSQRLENHGLEPNVEIVPKGTLSWGSRQSSSGSNPWVSSSLSPKADGGTVSPSHVSRRPSSGGSGTRPSTAGSDRTQEPVSYAWGSNSRPSSASGTLSSSQTSSSTFRPKSAENRPNSSQLSRFAEPMSKSSVAWGASSTAERLGVKPSKEDGFSLSSGDFPSLGSEKDNLGKDIETEDHDRPSSASSRIAPGKEDTKSQDDLDRGIVNTWRADGTQIGEDDIRSSMENWQGDHHQYNKNNAPPQNFGPWHGPPVNGPGGVWYGGRPRGPPFGAPVPPGGFPGEPFPYYHHQMPPGPPPPLADSQAVSHRGAGPRGPHPKNGDFYRPQVPDNFLRPGMPFRPGFYPGPHGHHAPPGSMGFEGYYGPRPMGFCNSEHDVQYMGMGAGGPVYSGFPGPRPDIGDSHARAGHPSGRPLPGQMEADRLEDTQGIKRSLKKNNQYDDQREEGENHENMMQRNTSYPRKGRLPVISSKKNEWGAEVDTEEAISSMRQAPNENASHSYEFQVHSTDTMIKSFEETGNVKAFKNSEDMQSFSPELLPLASEKDSSLPAVAKNSILMHKIDSLNAKIRVSDGRNDGPSAKRDEEKNKFRVPDMKSNYAGSVGNATEHFERTAVSSDYISGTHEGILARSDMRRSSQGGPGRTEHRGKGKFISQDGDGWRKRPVNTESSSTVLVSNIVTAPSINAHGTNLLVDASENSVINLTGRTEGDSVETVDSTDNQRAKMRELAKQRALQLQKEEEERIREQKAKALAKLEELNRRTIEVTNQKADQSLATRNNSIKQEELPTAGESVVADTDQRSHVPGGFSLISNPVVTTVDNEKSGNRLGESVQVSMILPQDIQNTGFVESDISPSPANEDGARKEPSQFNDGGIFRPKGIGQLHRHNTLQKSLHEKSASDVASDEQRDHSLVATVDSSSHVDPSCETKLNESNVLDVSNTVVELPTGHHRKKINRPSKYKNKVYETHVAPAVAPASDTNPGKELIESGQSKDSLSYINSSDSTVVEHDREVLPQDDCPSLPNEESQVRVQRKHNPSRKLPRNQQSNRFSDKLHGSDTVVWAPVRVQNKGSVDANENSMQESANPTKGTNMAQSSYKGKRAEVERYVPKPVAKELAQQGSISPISASTKSNEGPATEQTSSVISARPQPISTVTASTGSTVDTNEWDVNHNKHKKDSGIWKQQDLADSSHAKGLYFGTIPISEAIMDIQQSENVCFVKSVIKSANADIGSSGGISASGGDSVPNNTTADVVNKYPSVKGQGATGRGKRNLSKGSSRSTGNHPDPENGIGDEVDGSIQSDRGLISKESRSFGERTSSQWQPKSHSNAVYAQDEDRHSGSESVKKDHPQRKVQAAPRNDDNYSVNTTKVHPGLSVNVESNAAKSNANRHQETEREKKPGHPYSPNQEQLGFGESGGSEHNVPSGFRRNPRQNNHRPSRGNGDWNAGHNNNSFRERPRHIAQYKYQPVGPLKSDSPEEVADGEQRHRSRGQGNGRRGGQFYKRQSSSSHIEDSQG